MKDRFDFLNVKISVINLQGAIEAIKTHPFKEPGYICFPDASVVKEAAQDNNLLQILNDAHLTMPDGKPSELAARLLGHKKVSTVSGFHLCRSLLNTQLTHFFYGGTPALLQQLRDRLEQDFPQARVLGYKAPPFVAKEALATSADIAADIDEISRLKPDLVWVGISSPKQDYLMHHYYQQFDRTLMLGVGGVFLYLADESLKSPEWMKKLGLRWLYRLSKEPKRLWPKYYGTIVFLLQNCGFFLRLPFKKTKQIPATEI